jgi:hypothetical protein
MRKFVIMLLLTTFSGGLFAARLTLRNGTVVVGDFISGNSQGIVFMDDQGVRRTFSLNQVQMLDFSAQSASAFDRPDFRPPDNNAYRSDDRRGDSDWARLPRGTEINVRTDESINSRSAAEGRTYPASIMQDIVDERGAVVIPRGSEASLIVREVNEGGTLNNGNFILDVDSVRVNGKRYAVSTTDIETKDANGIGKNKRTAEMVGGGAVLGTLLGAIAGGGKGAAIGAAAGAAAGGGAEILTKGKEIRVPAETVLHFRLDQPLHLREVR